MKNVKNNKDKKKYNSKKTTVDGIEFDSKKEANRYKELKDMESKGEILDLKLQVPYVLIPAQYESILTKKIIERQCVYKADFTYYIPEGEYGLYTKLVVEDVKGYKKGPAYSLYVIKRKLMLQLYGIRIKEV